MLFLFRSAPEVEKRIHSKFFRKFWRSRGTKEPAYITVHTHNCTFGTYTQLCLIMRLRKNAARGSNASDIGLLVRQLLQRQHKDSQGQQNEIKDPEKTSVSRNLLLLFCLTLKWTQTNTFTQTCN